MKQRRWGQVVGIELAIAILVCVGLVPPALAASVPGVTDTTITIGITSAMSGNASLYGKPAEMASAIYSEWGKNINGRDIKVILYDDACDPVKGIAAIKKLIYDDKVFMINSGMCSNAALAEKPTLVSAGTPYMSLGSSAAGIYVPVSKNIFTPTWTSTIAEQAMADFALGIPGVNTLGVIRHTDEWGTSQYQALSAHLRDKYHKTFAADVTLERGTPDATSQVLKLKQANVDAVFTLIYPADTTTFVRDAYRLGLTAYIISGPATGVGDQYNSLKSLEPLKKFFGPYIAKYPIDNPKVRVYEQIVIKYFPSHAFDDWSVFSTGGPLVIIDALRKAGRNLTQEKFIDVLETQYTNWEPDNYIGSVPLTFSKTDHVGMHGSTFAALVNGKFTVIHTYKDYEMAVKK